MLLCIVCLFLFTGKSVYGAGYLPSRWPQKEQPAQCRQQQDYRFGGALTEVGLQDSKVLRAGAGIAVGIARGPARAQMNSAMGETWVPESTFRMPTFLTTN